MKCFESANEANGKTVKITYLTYGGTDITNELGDICSGLDVPVKLILHTYESCETERDVLEFMGMIADARDSDLFMFVMHGDPSGYKRYDQLLKEVEANGIDMFLQCFITESMGLARKYFKEDDGIYGRITTYLHLGGHDNKVSLIRYLCKVYGDGDIEADEPHIIRQQGIYHKGFPRDVTRAEYMATLDPSVPTVGLLIPHGFWVYDRMEFADELIDSIERRGAAVIPVFFNSMPDAITGSLGCEGVCREFFTDGDRTIVDCIVIGGGGFSMLTLSNPSCGEVSRDRNFFASLGVPVLGGISIFRSQKEWEEDGIGMEGGELAIQLALPELDGQLTTVPLLFSEKDRRGTEYNSFRKDRIERIADMAVGWAKVSHVPVAERKISILFNGGDLSNAKIGRAGGIDSLESVANILKAMARRGYTLDHVPENGREIIDEILAAVTTNFDWVSDGHIREKAVDFLGKDVFEEWRSELTDGPRDWMVKDWGEPVGDIMTIDGQFIIPGVRNGNVYIGFEPDRGKHDKAEQLIHDPYLSTPHSYLAYYHWIERIFGTDVHIHIGTHGSCEWLPGKGNGLSQDCFPDIMMGGIPHLYVYVIDDPSEGIVAKRRKKSVLVDYLMPSMTRAGAYEGIGDLEGLIQEYLYCKQTMQHQKMKDLEGPIHECVERLSMFKEIGLEEDAPPEEVAGRCEVIFDRIADLKDNLITDGLHIFGDVPQGQRMDEMIYCLTRLKNGPVPSLRDSIASHRGLDLDAILAGISKIDEGTGVLNGELLDSIDDEMQELISAMHGLDFDPEACRELAVQRYGDDPWLLEVVAYICTSIHPNLCRMVEEVDNLVAGMDGCYVPPGPSGSPTRGNAHLLPTGKNYYSLDPEAVPLKESWKVGVKTADEMISHYVEEEGRYPENVGIVLWSCDVMKTGGDDIAYVLWLMGVRPVWGSIGGKITGLEVIPLEELGRPRIDVVSRISSLFRDTFPNLFQLIDDAVKLVSELDEDDEKNYIKSHLAKDIAEMISKGIPYDEARELASIRVFGEPPGTHGAGVDTLVESSKWNTIEDLAQIYITCGCSAYGRKWRGEQKPELFRQRLEQLDVAVKNLVDREIDMIDMDDGYSYFGGINAVIRAAGKEKPRNYMSDTSDPDHTKLTSLENEMAKIVRSRLLNPKWIEGLKQHGFIGANLLEENFNHAFGWDATSDVIENWMYDALADHFLFDEENRKWIEENNPYALNDLINNFMEAYERGMWDASEETVRKLKELFLHSEEILEELTK